MARRIINQNDIEEAANSLAAAGKKVTIGTVYDALGRRGGNTTIQQGLQEWEAKRGMVPAAPAAPAMPSAASEIIASHGGKLEGMFAAMGSELFSAAKAEADAAVTPVIEGLRAKHQELQESLATAARIEADRDAELAEMETALTKAEAEHMADVQRIGHLEAEVEAKAAQIKALEGAATTATTEAREQASSIAKLEAKLAVAEAREQAAQSRIQDLTAAHASTVTQLQEATAAKTALQDELKDSQKSLAVAEKALALAQQEGKTLQAALTKAETAHEATREKLNVLSGQNGGLTVELATARKAMEEAQAQAKEWRDLVEKRGAEVSTCQRALAEAEDRIAALKAQAHELEVGKKQKP